jgi:hypothetical protein
VSDWLLLAGGLMSAFAIGFYCAYSVKMVRRFFEQI